jgi:phasin family protein
MKDMFKNPMEMWSKAFDPKGWTDMSNKMMESMPWLQSFGKNESSKKATNTAFNFAKNMKNMEGFLDLNKLSLENTQAVLHRQTEILQKHSTELYKLMQDMSSARDPEANRARQADLIRSSLEDLKELTEMYSKFNLEAFEAISNKMSEQMQQTKASCCPSQMPEANPSKSKKQ